jgi:hypothetical protein
MPPKRSRDEIEPAALHGPMEERRACPHDHQRLATTSDRALGHTTEVPHAHAQVGNLPVYYP